MRHVLYIGLGGLVVVVSVEDMAEGEGSEHVPFRGRAAVESSRKRGYGKDKPRTEWEIDLVGKISLVGRNRRMKSNALLALVGKGMDDTKETAHLAEEDVCYVSRSSQ